MSDQKYTKATLSGRKYYTTSIAGGELFCIGDRIKIEILHGGRAIRFTTPDDRLITKQGGIFDGLEYLEPEIGE